MKMIVKLFQHEKVHSAINFTMVSASCTAPSYSLLLEFSSCLPLSPLEQILMQLGIQDHSQPLPNQPQLHSLLLKHTHGIIE